MGAFGGHKGVRERAPPPVGGECVPHVILFLYYEEILAEPAPRASTIVFSTFEGTTS